jgi:hypothetical protein
VKRVLYIIAMVVHFQMMLMASAFLRQTEAGVLESAFILVIGCIALAISIVAGVYHKDWWD